MKAQSPCPKFRTIQQGIDGNPLRINTAAGCSRPRRRGPPLISLENEHIMTN